MPVVRFSQSIAAGATFSPNLSPYDRFGGGGGKIRLQSTVQSTGVQTDVLETVFVGSELVENRGPMAVERVAGAGPDAFTPITEAYGAPGDPIVLTYQNTNVAARSVTGILYIDNA
jgi:hypothetical protein